MRKYYIVKLKGILQNKWPVLLNSINIKQKRKAKEFHRLKNNEMQQLNKMWHPELNLVSEKKAISK